MKILQQINKENGRLFNHDSGFGMAQMVRSLFPTMETWIETHLVVSYGGQSGAVAVAFPC
jgi:hypothetical protein